VVAVFALRVGSRSARVSRPRRFADRRPPRIREGADFTERYRFHDGGVVFFVTFVARDA
jgi:hypothetical protein